MGEGAGVKRFLLPLAVLVFAADASAQGVVCRDAPMCADLVKRHDASEFDYGVLAGEVARLGGEREVLALLRDPKLAGRVLRLAEEPGGSDALRDTVIRAWPGPGVEAQLRLMRKVQSPVVREVALRTLREPGLAEGSLRALETQRQAWDPTQAARHLEVLKAAPPHREVARALGAVPGERGAGALVRMLGSGDAEAVVVAFGELSSFDAVRAEGDLRATLLKSAPEDAGSWARALELAGRNVPSFDAVAFGYGVFRDRELPPHVRAVGLHSALLYPAGDKGEVKGDVGALLPILVSLPPSDRLAETVPSHGGMQTARALRAMLEVWQGKDTEAAAAFARALGRARPSPARPLLRDMYAKTSDYRVQVAALEALRSIGEDGDWIATAVRGHPLRAVERAAGVKLGVVPAQCRPKAKLRESEAVRLPFFQSGRYADGKPAPRWELLDAQPVPGGWLAGYQRGLLRYRSDDTSEATGFTGRVVAILPDVQPEPGQRARVFWVVEEGPKVARLYRYEVDGPLAKPVTLPKGVRVVRIPETFRASARGWALEFGGDQPTLTVDRTGRLRRLCSVARR